MVYCFLFQHRSPAAFERAVGLHFFPLPDIVEEYLADAVFITYCPAQLVEALRLGDVVALPCGADFHKPRYIRAMHTFPSKEERERILYRSFMKVGQDVKEMIKDVVNKKSPKAHTKTDTSSQEKLFGEIQNSFLYFSSVFLCAFLYNLCSIRHLQKCTFSYRAKYKNQISWQHSN